MEVLLTMELSSHVRELHAARPTRERGRRARVQWATVEAQLDVSGSGRVPDLVHATAAASRKGHGERRGCERDSHRGILDYLSARSRENQIEWIRNGSSDKKISASGT